MATMQTKASHTPGPWVIEPDVITDRRGYRHRQVRAFFEDHGHDDVCQVNARVDAIPSEANARLIAAAPDMLAELIDVARSMDLHAELLERWAAESRAGGWSTHQVDAQRQKADLFRRQAAHVRQVIDKAAGG